MLYKDLLVFVCRSVMMETDEKRLIIWKAVSERLKQLASSTKLESDDLAKFVFLFGLKRLRDEECLMRLIEIITPQIPSLQTDSIVQLLYGLARLRVRSDVVFKIAAREVAGRASEMSGKQLG